MASSSALAMVEEDRWEEKESEGLGGEREEKRSRALVELFDGIFVIFSSFFSLS